ncbi:MAG: MmgE/PrpD family protein [Chloroflexi bacterium]|nr:MmgE/PrpD family protein [Chloroflexota bacterium]
MASTDTYSRLFAQYARNTRWETLPPATVHEVKRRIIDSIGVAIAAFDEDAPVAARAYAQDYAYRGNSRAATVWGTAARVNPEVAAFASGLMVRYLDFNDTYLSQEPLHPSDLIPGLMALAEWAGKGPKELIPAIAAGYEISMNLCDAASLRAHQWDHVNYIGIAEAAGAGRLLGLSQEATEQAISIAIVPHAAMRQTRAGELSMWKGAAAANSARHGIFGALLAAKGMTGPFQPFEGEMGFFHQLLGGTPFKNEALKSLQNMAPPTRISDAYIKFWPVEYHAQSAVEAALQVRKAIGGGDGIRQVRIDTFKASYEIIAKDPEKWAPKTRETADHSLQYIVAVALLDGQVTQESYTPAMLADPRVASLLQRTKLAEDDDLTRGYPEGIPNRIGVVTSEGREVAKEVRYPLGHARNPMSDAALEQKFLANVGRRFTEAQARTVLDLAWRLEEQPDVSGLVRAIRITKGGAATRRKAT